MSSANYITARDLFLAHHWNRYIPFDRETFRGFLCGRVRAKEGDIVTIGDEGSSVTKTVVTWARLSLREPKAAESSPSVHEVLSVGDWIGVDDRGETVLFAPCSQRGASAIQDADELAARSRKWNEFQASVRRFFVDRDFCEVTTPILATSPGTEPFLDPLSVMTESDQKKTARYLITSPEFHLKKALGAGLPRIFEIARCFRNKEGGSHHRIEFHMLEWYRAFATLEEIAGDVEALIRHFVPKADLKRIAMRDLFRDLVDFDLRPETQRDQLAAVASACGVRVIPDDDFADLFHKIFLEKIEPQLEKISGGGPLLISGYPSSMAALARIAQDGFADRFEVYWSGLEICNAFHELNDPSENHRRFESDNAMKLRSGREIVPIDEELLRAFDLGVPPAGGIALGLERLFMAVHGLSDIEMVRPFLTSRV